MQVYKGEELLQASYDEEIKVNTNVMYETYQNNEKPYKNLKDFLIKYKKSSDKGDSNIFERGRASYNLTDAEAIKYFFRKYTCCVLNEFSMKFAEKQNKESSGIFLDMDIYQESSEDMITEYQDICSIILESLERVLDLGKEEIHIVIMQKRKIIEDKSREINKNGLHILIPGVKISRGAKKILIEELFKDIKLHCDDVFHYVPERFRDDIVDKHSAHVPVFLYGSLSKDGGTPYDVKKVYGITYAKIGNSRSFNDKTREFLDKSLTAWEFSLNWEVADEKYPTYITKKHYEVREEYASREKELMQEKREESIEEELMYNTDNLDFEYIKNLLDILAPFRYNIYKYWFPVLVLLAKRGPEYKVLARYFSKKCPSKYSPGDFEKHWYHALSTSRNSDMNVGYIEFLARKDNKEECDKIKKNSIFGLIDEIIQDHVFRGSFTHYHVALILYRVFQNKLVHDIDRRCWYEYVTENDQREKGEIHKWRKWGAECPNLSSYISEDLYKVLYEHYNILQMKQDKTDKDTDIDLRKLNFLKSMSKNLANSIKALLDDNFKRGVINQAKNKFNRRNFSRRLDLCDDVHYILGVGNGILKLGPKCELITEAHSYPISHFTPVDYVPYDPYDPNVKEVYLTLRNMFTDKESDSFEFLLMFMASSLDFGIKENVILLLHGEGANGKSALLELMINLLNPTDKNGYAGKVDTKFWTEVKRNADSATPSLIALIFARFAYSSEFPEGARLILSKLKEVLSGENMYARGLFQEGINFIVKAMFMLLSNHEFEIDGTDEGTWRRILYMRLRVTFVIGKDFDPNNPFHRKANPDLQKKWNKDPRILTAFLSILVHNYEILWKKYGGCLRLIPKPTIEKDTVDMRNRQDKFNNFICSHIVKTTTEGDPLSFDALISHYDDWHVKCFSRHCDRNYAYNNFKTSKLGKYISKTASGVSIIANHKFIPLDYIPTGGETFYSSSEATEDTKVISETPEEFYERKCREFDEMKRYEE